MDKNTVSNSSFSHGPSFFHILTCVLEVRMELITLCSDQALASSSSRNSLCIGTRPSCLMLQKCWTARAAV